MKREMVLSDVGMWSMDERRINLILGPNSKTSYEKDASRLAIIYPKGNRTTSTGGL